MSKPGIPRIRRTAYIIQIPLPKAKAEEARIKHRKVEVTKEVIRKEKDPTASLKAVEVLPKEAENPKAEKVKVVVTRRVTTKTHLIKPRVKAKVARVRMVNRREMEFVANSTLLKDVPSQTVNTNTNTMVKVRRPRRRLVPRRTKLPSLR